VTPGGVSDDRPQPVGAVRRVGGGVVRAAGGAVKGTVRGTVGVTTGARCILTGVGRIVRTPWLWPYGLAPAAIGLVVYGAAFWWMLDLVSAARGLAAEYTGAVGGVIATVLTAAVVVAAVLVAFYVAFPSVVRVIAAPFLALLADRVYADVAGGDPPRVPGSRLVRWVLRPIWESLVLLAIRVVVTALALPLVCVPVVGAGLFFAALLPVEGMDLLDWAQGARAVPLKERLRFVRRHLAASAGLGLGSAGLLLVPILNVLFLPALVVGAVLLDQRVSPDFAAHLPAREPEPGPAAGEDA